ncbi:hypothetical protein PR202_gb16152 [Eleusine coracana subsp. coracana]|uniref:DNA-directed RNA polymerase RBP11-like dimerisation domain-containing protein n=1 Tax=Eleusine coracana subsp. coracana TaxID=191504 RepID=A0AAV5EZP1_ELECO|nr:hypothetical protein PR202_gb16152 [Eleusine coracana subsp. coracana]
MEHGSVTKSSASTFSIIEEDHTLANSVRFVLNQESKGGAGFDLRDVDDDTSRWGRSTHPTKLDAEAASRLLAVHRSPRVAFCGYSIPHPADNKVNIRVQTTGIRSCTPDTCILLAGDPAKDVLKDALQDLMVMCQHIRGTFDNAVADHRANKSAEQMDIDPKQK